MDSSESTADISQVLGRLRSEPGLPSTTSCPLQFETIRRYDRPQSTVYMLRASTEDASKTIVAKLYKPESAGGVSANAIDREYRVAKAVSQKLSASNVFAVAKPIASYPDLRANISEAYSGSPVSLSIKRASSRFSSQDFETTEKSCEDCGRWIREFQRVSEDVPGRPYDHEATAQEIESLIDLLRNRGVVSVRLADQLHEHLRTLISLTRQPVRTTGMHSDFVPSNVLFCEGKIVVLDLADYRRGPACRDPITFMHALDNYLRNPLTDPSRIWRLKIAFTKGLGAIARQDEVPVVSLFETRQTLGELINLEISSP